MLSELNLLLESDKAMTYVMHEGIEYLVIFSRICWPHVLEWGHDGWKYAPPCLAALILEKVEVEQWEPCPIPFPQPSRRMVIHDR